MPVCILTDNTASFAPTSVISDAIYSLPLTSESGAYHPPTAKDFRRCFDELGRRYSGIFVLTASKEIFTGYETALQAAQSHNSAARILVFDSHHTGPALGFLAQLGAQAANSQESLPEIEQHLRAARPHFYTLLCPAKDFSISPVGSDPIPVYSLEEGALSLYNKVRSPRHLLGCFQEFLEEFEHPQQIACFHGANTSLRTRTLRETASGLFPETPFSEMELAPALAAFFGPQAIGLTLMELPK